MIGLRPGRPGEEDRSAGRRQIPGEFTELQLFEVHESCIRQQDSGLFIEVVREFVEGDGALAAIEDVLHELQFQDV